MMNKNLLALFSALSFCVSGMSMAAVDCSNAANQHKDEPDYHHDSALQDYT